MPAVSGVTTNSSIIGPLYGDADSVEEKTTSVIRTYFESLSIYIRMLSRQVPKWSPDLVVGVTKMVLADFFVGRLQQTAFNVQDLVWPLWRVCVCV